MSKVNPLNYSQRRSLFETALEPVKGLHFGALLATGAILIAKGVIEDAGKAPVSPADRRKILQASLNIAALMLNPDYAAGSVADYGSNSEAVAFMEAGAVVEVAPGTVQNAQGSLAVN